MRPQAKPRLGGRRKRKKKKKPSHDPSYFGLNAHYNHGEVGVSEEGEFDYPNREDEPAHRHQTTLPVRKGRRKKRKRQGAPRRRRQRRYKCTRETYEVQEGRGEGGDVNDDDSNLNYQKEEEEDIYEYVPKEGDFIEELKCGTEKHHDCKICAIRWLRSSEYNDVPSHIWKEIDKEMESAIRIGRVEEMAQEMYKYYRDEMKYYGGAYEEYSGGKKMPHIDVNSLEEHYQKNHSNSITIFIFQRIRIMTNLNDDLLLTEGRININDGPKVMNPLTGQITGRRQTIKHYDPKVVKQYQDRNDKIINTCLKAQQVLNRDDASKESNLLDDVFGGPGSRIRKKKKRGRRR